MKQAKLFSMNKDDCPVFDGLYEYCQVRFHVYICLKISLSSCIFYDQSHCFGDHTTPTLGRDIKNLMTCWAEQPMQ